jgi:hypothetical protein
LKNGDLLRQRKNPDRASAHDCAPWIFSLPCISPFLNGLRILIFLTESSSFNRRPCRTRTDFQATRGDSTNDAWLSQTVVGP